MTPFNSGARLRGRRATYHLTRLAWISAVVCFPSVLVAGRAIADTSAPVEAAGEPSAGTGEAEALLEEVQSKAPDRLSIHGYYDLQYIDSDNELTGSYVQNELSVFLRASTRDERWTLFGEIETDWIDGNDFLVSRGGKSGEVEIETGWLEFRHSDRLRIRAGKLLLPEYWQTYHYPNLTLSTLPPLMTGNIFPKNILALQAMGDWWTANERGFGYTVYVGDGGDPEDGDLNHDDIRSAGGRLTLRLAGRNKPEILETLDVSVSAYAGDGPDGGSEIILGLDTQLRLGRFELQAELAHGDRPRNTRRLAGRFGDGSGEALGFYVQPAYRLSPQWHVFYRYDDLDLDSSGWTPWDEKRHSLGINFRPRPNISFKLEYFHGDPEARNEAFSGVAGSIVFNF